MPGLSTTIRYAANGTDRHLQRPPLRRIYRSRLVSLPRCSFTDRANVFPSRSPDGQTLILASSDGYCSIVVFDLAELGTVHPTQQHHRQLAAIAQSHSHSGGSVSTPHLQPVASVPHSPAVSTMRHSPAPARSEREGSTASSIAPLPPLHSNVSIPPMFGAQTSASASGHVPPSSRSSTEVPPTPEQSEREDTSLPIIRDPPGPGSESGASTATFTGEESVKRAAPEPAEAPKKKRRVVLTHLGNEEGK